MCDSGDREWAFFEERVGLSGLFELLRICLGNMEIYALLVAGGAYDPPKLAALAIERVGETGTRRWAENFCSATRPHN